MIEQKILTVSQLNFTAKQLLEQTLGFVHVSGEISNMVKHSSGHWYFSLKDESAQIRCAMFRGANRKVSTPIDNGQQVVVQAKASLYTTRGEYQLIVEDMQDAGAGALQIAFEKLKKQLAQQGLFDAAHKQALPKLPKQIGVITSPTGAAIRDILKILNRRFASIPVIIYPCTVQGAQASKEIAKAIAIANQRQECDVLIVGRGGGSLEDLWCFNEPEVAHAIFASQIPIISGVGHEVDITIADLVADVRAATPSAAAETVSPDAFELAQRFDYLQTRLNHLITNILQTAKLVLEKCEKSLKHPRDQLKDYQQLLQQLTLRLQSANSHYLSIKQQQFKNAMAKLQAVSPLAILERGYAVISQQQKTITRLKQLSSGDEIKIRMADGECLARVER